MLFTTFLELAFSPYTNSLNNILSLFFTKQHRINQPHENQSLISVNNSVSGINRISNTYQVLCFSTPGYRFCDNDYAQILKTCRLKGMHHKIASSCVLAYANIKIDSTDCNGTNTKFIS